MENRLYIPQYENMEDNSKNKHETVLQDWVCKLNFKQQTGLISAIRGFDGEEGESFGYSLKDITKMVRGVILKNADSSTKFMSLSPLNTSDVVDTLVKWTEHKEDWHWLNHIVMAMHTISLYHYNDYTKLYYLELCKEYARQVKCINERIDNKDNESKIDTSTIEFVSDLNNTTDTTYFKSNDNALCHNRDLSITYDGSYCSVNYIVKRVNYSAVMYILDNYTNFNEIIYTWNHLTKEGQVSNIHNLQPLKNSDKAIEEVNNYISTVNKSIISLPGNLIVKFKYSIPVNEFDDYLKKIELEAKEHKENPVTFNVSGCVREVTTEDIPSINGHDINSTKAVADLEHIKPTPNTYSYKCTLEGIMASLGVSEPSEIADFLTFHTNIGQIRRKWPTLSEEGKKKLISIEAKYCHVDLSIKIMDNFKKLPDPLPHSLIITIVTPLNIGDFHHSINDLIKHIYKIS